MKLCSSIQKILDSVRGIICQNFYQIWMGKLLSLTKGIHCMYQWCIFFIHGMQSSIYSSSCLGSMRIVKSPISYDQKISFSMLSQMQCTTKSCSTRSHNNNFPRKTLHSSPHHKTTNKLIYSSCNHLSSCEDEKYFIPT